MAGEGKAGGRAKGQPGEGAVGAKKPTVCPVSAAEFDEHAPAQLDMELNGQVKAAVRKRFSTGSFGWFLNDKMDVMVNGKVLKVQIGVNLTVVGSKDAPR